MVDFKRAKELMDVEKACVVRNVGGRCNRKCEDCDLVQKPEDLIEAYRMASIALDEFLWKIKQDEKEESDVDFICRKLVEWFDAPCQYILAGIDVSEYLNDTGYTDQVCEEKCRTDPELYAQCWKMFFTLLKAEESEEPCTN